MPLYISPPRSGKTNFLIEQLRQETASFHKTAVIVVPTSLQAQTLKRRLAKAGCGFGVRVLTFGKLYQAYLLQAGATYTLLNDPVIYRLLRQIIQQEDLSFYKAIIDKPGFIQSMRSLISELKAARIFPDDLLPTVANEPRLKELAQIYFIYQTLLQEKRWADPAGIGWLTVEALENKPIPVEWDSLWVDGFDTFTRVQLDMLRAVKNTMPVHILLTGQLERDDRSAVHQRFIKTRRQLEQHLSLRAEPLEVNKPETVTTLDKLEQSLFEPNPDKIGTTGIELLALPSLDQEVREALRWVKARIMRDGMKPHQVAILARSLVPYQNVLPQIGAEMGIPLRLVNGLELNRAPVIDALLSLLVQLLPAGNELPVLERRAVIRAWHSPYFDWSAEVAGVPIGIVPSDAHALDKLSRWANVLGGLEAWQSAFSLLANAQATQTPSRRDESADILLINVATLAAKFNRFLTRLTPPSTANSMRDYVGWLESLIGVDPAFETGYGQAPTKTALNLIEQIGDGDNKGQDIAALRRLKEILRGLVWAEDALDIERDVSFSHFLQELTGAIEGATYFPPTDPSAVLVSDVFHARGLGFRAVAVMGLSEGSFPAKLQEDPFLRDRDRDRLDKAGLALESSTDSSEQAFFYEAVTRASERLLLTRATLAENGAEWEPSAYWETVTGLTGSEPTVRLSADSVPLHDTASLDEYIESHVRQEDAGDNPAPVAQDRWQRLRQSADIFRQRNANTPTPHTGFTQPPQKFHPDFRWSVSALETYKACAFRFFVERTLKVRPLEAPQVGLTVAQLGTLYHDILEQTYKRVPESERTNPDALLAVLPDVAAQRFALAPEQDGFRPSAWWEESRKAIRDTLRETLIELCKLDDAYLPYLFEERVEATFSNDLNEQFRLVGIVDRIDRAPSGGLRIIDYKTAGSADYKKKALESGKRLQQPIYAQAVEQKLGESVADGFYWHIRHGEKSDLSLASIGREEADRLALDHAWTAVKGAQNGAFPATAPSDGCPSYCGAKSFCWQYKPGRNK